MIPTAWLEDFESIPFSGSEDKLFKGRFDTKYVLPADRLSGILGRLPRDYRILSFQGSSAQEYRSLYFDDERLTLYQDHQRGRLSRFKARFRLYPGSGFACAEIKMKTNRRQTRKWRRPISLKQFQAGIFIDPTDGCAEAPSIVLPEDLAPLLRARFSRLTLHRRDIQERLTIDTDLVFTDPRTGVSVAAEGLVVAEVKQSRSRPDSPFRRLMRDLRIPPAWFSKYCFGVYVFRPEVRHNRLKPKYRALAGAFVTGPAETGAASCVSGEPI